MSKWARGDANAHWGIEHIGLNVDDLDAEIARLKGLGAELLEGPIDVPQGPRIAFIKGPDDVRVELLPVARLSAAGASASRPEPMLASMPLTRGGIALGLRIRRGRRYAQARILS